MRKRHKIKKTKKKAHKSFGKLMRYEKIVNYFFILLNFIVVFSDRYEILKTFMKKFKEFFS